MTARRKRDFRGGNRFRDPQGWLNHVVATDPALRRVRLTYRPRYSSRLRFFGEAVLVTGAQPGRTLIGRKSLVSRNELLDTIIHEELHHRVWLRALRGGKRAILFTADIDLEEDYVEAVAARFLKRKQR